MKVKLLKKVRALFTCEYNLINKRYYLVYKKGLKKEEYISFNTADEMFQMYRENILFHAKGSSIHDNNKRNRIQPNIEIKHAQKDKIKSNQHESK